MTERYYCLQLDHVTHNGEAERIFSSEENSLHIQNNARLLCRYHLWRAHSLGICHSIILAKARMILWQIPNSWALHKWYPDHIHEIFYISLYNALAHIEFRSCKKSAPKVTLSPIDRTTFSNSRNPVGIWSEVGLSGLVRKRKVSRIHFMRMTPWANNGIRFQRLWRHHTNFHSQGRGVLDRIWIATTQKMLGPWFFV